MKKEAAPAAEQKGKSKQMKLYELTTPTDQYIYTFDAKLSYALYKAMQGNKAFDLLSFASHYTFATEKQAHIAAAILEERGYEIEKIIKESFTDEDENGGSVRLRVEESMYKLVEAKKRIPPKTTQK